MTGTVRVYLPNVAPGTPVEITHLGVCPNGEEIEVTEAAIAQFKLHGGNWPESNVLEIPDTSNAEPVVVEPVPAPPVWDPFDPDSDPEGDVIASSTDTTSDSAPPVSDETHVPEEDN